METFSLKTSPPHISIFLTEINTPQSGQILDETWYLVPPRLLQSKPNNPYLHHSNQYLFPSLFFPYLSFL